jgi:two-component system OmpR family response regulator
LVKPFAEGELVARINALLRRGDRPTQTVLRAGRLEIDESARRAAYGEVDLALGATEFRMLEFFARNAGIAFSRQQLLERIWDYDFDGSSNIVDVYVSALRRKLKGAGGNGVIETVWGVGYRMRA